MRIVPWVVALLLCSAGATAAGPRPLQNLRLADALRLLQRDGLPIVFSSEIVTSHMRVAAEPRATTPRQKLDEILAPNGLSAESGPGGVILVVRVRTSAPTSAGTGSVVRRPANGAAPPAMAPAPPPSYSDHVTVSSAIDTAPTTGVSKATLDHGVLEAAGGALEADGLAAVHAMPRVSALDDFRSEFSVRGSPYRQIGIVIDGVPTPWLQHTAYGRSELGSVSMFGSDSLDNATLQAGAYPRLYGDTLGAQLELNLREGSRESTRLTGTVGGMTTAVVGDGPIGVVGRGSWIAGVRNSYRSWPPRPHSPGNSGFGFADLHAKLVYDVSPTQQVSVSSLGGQSTLDTIDELPAAPLATGTEGTALIDVGWRSMFASRTVIRQRVFVVGQDLSATLSTGQVAGGSSNRALGYRGDVQHGVLGGVLAGGVEVSRLSGRRDIETSGPAAIPYSLRGAWMTHAGYLDFARTSNRGLSFEVGVRASASTLIQQHALTPWVLGAWRFAREWDINASAGTSRQFADLDAIMGSAGQPTLRPERAIHFDVGIEQRLSTGIRWQATLFNRREQDVLRGPDPVLALQTASVEPMAPGSYRNALSGVARGLEFVVTPERKGHLSGWLSYTYDVMRQHDANTQETFWSNFDRRHTFNAAGMFSIGPRTSAGLVLRAASGVPIPGYFDLRNGTLIAGDRLNTVRLPAYIRLDGRVQRRVFASRHQATLFAEIVNALNRGNVGLASGVGPTSGAAIGFSRALVPRQVSVGLTIALSR